MKTKNLNLAKLALFLFMGLSITLVSCSGEDGTDGIDGIDGEQGPPGQDGADGQDGNANVVASDWFQIEWTNAQPTESSMHIEIPEVDMTEFLANGGVVLVYLKIINDYPKTYTLPYEYNNVTFDYYMANVPDEFDGISVTLDDPDENGVYLDVLENPNYTLRYVLVPANVAEETGIADKMPENFGEAAALLGLD
ncbi:MAG: collagen-like protein [Muricauda sp.]|nr:hypothetical protein [Allomuricauda sp.]MBA4746142.1 collagen-like protein [Allomuricauda sp.]